jgi:hypothetical protein
MLLKYLLKLEQLLREMNFDRLSVNCRRINYYLLFLAAITVFFIIINLNKVINSVN